MKITKLLFLNLIFISSHSLVSQWSTDPTENNIVAWGLLNPLLISDMNNGVIVIGQTHPQNPVIYGQRVSVNCNLLWPGSRYGLRFIDSPYEQWLTLQGSDPEHIHGMSDGAGGCYVGYYLARFIGYIGTLEPEEYYDFDYCIQRLDPEGNRLFGPSGFKLMPNEPDSTGRGQNLLYWCSDGHNGLYVTFFRGDGFWGTDHENDGTYLGRISPEGEYIWGPKKMHVSRVNYIPYLDKDFNLNLYYTIGETYSKIPDKFIKINAADGVIISEREIEIGVGEYGFNAFYKYCNSTNSSAIFAFRDFRADTLRIQKLDTDGNKLWGNEPVIVTPTLEGYTLFELESDHRGGAYIFYLTQDDTFRLAHFNNDGQRMWNRTFISELGYKSMLSYEKMTATSIDGNVFVLMDGMRYLTKISPDGTVLWKTTVTSRDTIFIHSGYHDLQPDELGGCIVLWHELDEGFVGFRAQRIDRNGNLGGPTAVTKKTSSDMPEQLHVTAVYPNPFNSSVKIKFMSPLSENLSLKIYNLLGKEVSTLYSGQITAGEHSLDWHGENSGNHPVSSGVYFLVFQTDSQVMSRKILLIK